VIRPSTNLVRSSTENGRRSIEADAPPILLTVDEAAELLRTTRRAMYAMVERRQVPGVVRIRRRVLFLSADLLEWLDQNREPSPKD
jgi:excisionase family DNA binding protein